MAKLHFRPYIPTQTVLFPQRIDENIAADDPVRIVNAVVDNLNLDNFKKLYKETGRSAYHPKMMLKVIIYAYMNNIYSCRKIEKLLLRDIHYIWLAGHEHPDFITINRFRNRVKEEINNVFTQLVLVLADKGFISLDVEYIDGKLIDDPTNTLYDPQNPYENRDKRFYQSLLYNGSMWETYEINIVTNTVDESKNGSCKPRLGKARCGYGLRKFIEELDPSTNIYGGYAQSNNFPYFRYAEILLNYAEARNEASSTPDQSVYDAINQVRARAGQPALPDGLTKDEMRKRIKNERRVELFMEEHRFYDLRRWLDGDVLANPIMGINCYDNNVTRRYEISQIEERVFTGEHYFLPIPLTEQQKNPLLAE